MAKYVSEIHTILYWHHHYVLLYPKRIKQNQIKLLNVSCHFSALNKWTFYSITSLCCDLNQALAKTDFVLKCGQY